MSLASLRAVVDVESAGTVVVVVSQSA